MINLGYRLAVAKTFCLLRPYCFRDCFRDSNVLRTSLRTTPRPDLNPVDPPLPQGLNSCGSPKHARSAGRRLCLPELAYMHQAGGFLVRLCSTCPADLHVARAASWRNFSALQHKRVSRSACGIDRGRADGWTCVRPADGTSFVHAAADADRDARGGPNAARDPVAGTVEDAARRREAGRRHAARRHRRACDQVGP